MANGQPWARYWRADERLLYAGRSMDMGIVLDLIEREQVTMLTLVGDTSGRPLLDQLYRDRGEHSTSSLLLLGSGEDAFLSGDVKDGLLKDASERLGHQRGGGIIGGTGAGGRPLWTLISGSFRGWGKFHLSSSSFWVLRMEAEPEKLF